MTNQIRAVMKRVGVKFEELAEATDLSTSYLNRMANSKRNVSLKNLEKIAVGISSIRDVRVSVDDLVSDIQQVAVVGRVGAGQKIFFVDDLPPGEGMYKVSAPASLGTVVGVEVEGESMWPRYADGEVVLYGEKEGPTNLIGRECVVRLLDGSTYLKRLYRGSSKAAYNLFSENGPLLEDQEVEWAAAVKWPQRLTAPRARTF